MINLTQVSEQYVHENSDEQFVAVWKWGGHLWCGEVVSYNGGLAMYDPAEDMFDVGCVPDGVEFTFYKENT